MPGIDSLINDRADAYRQNPQQLQPRYQGNKDLIEMLAKQKIATEKEEVARQLQMQMDQDPSTISEQLDAKLMGLTKNEMAQQTGSLLQKKQGDEQRNMKELVAKMGQQGQPSQGPGQPVAPPAPTPGIAANPAPNMQKFSQGGIVGFSGGGETTLVAGGYEGGDLSEEEKLLKRLNISEAEISAILARPPVNPRSPKLTREQVISQLVKQKAPRVKNANPRGIGFNESVSQPPEGGLDSLAKSISTTQDAQVGGQTQDAQVGGQTQDAQVQVQADPDPDPAPLVTQGATAPTPFTASTDPRQKNLNSLIEGQTSRDPGKEYRESRDNNVAFRGRDAMAKKYAAMEAEQKAMMEGINDPRKRRSERIAATLAGAGGRSYTMGQGMQAAGSAERQRQEGESKSMLADLNKSRVAAMNSDLEISQSAIASGETAGASANEGITSGITNLTKNIGDEANNATQIADLNARAKAAFDQTIATVESANIAAGARNRATKVNKEMRTLMAAAVAAGSKAETLTKVNEIVSKVTESWNLGAAMRPTAQKISALEKQLTDGDGNTKENVDALKLLKAKDQAELRATYEPLFLYHESLGGQASKKPETPSPAGSGAFKSPTGITSTILPTPGA